MDPSYKNNPPKLKKQKQLTKIFFMLNVCYFPGTILIILHGLSHLILTWDIGIFLPLILQSTQDLGRLSNLLVLSIFFLN